MMLCPELLVQGHMLLYVKGLKSGYLARCHDGSSTMSQHDESAVTDDVRTLMKRNHYRYERVRGDSVVEAREDSSLGECGSSLRGAKPCDFLESSFGTST